MMRISAAGIAAAALVTVAACSNAPDEEYIRVTINGEVQMTAGPVPAGTVHFRLYNLESLQGELQHPLEEIEDFQSDSPLFSHTFDYPLHKGEGLAVHAWVDTDGDGIFCTPTARLDPGGLAYMRDTPVSETSITILLTANCKAANFFYPPPL